MQVPDLEPRIHAILSAPGTDLSTISAKRVRRLLLGQEDVPQDIIKDNKEEVDGLISTIFARVSEEKGFQHDEEDAEGGRTASTEPPAASKKRRRTSIDDRGDRSSAKATKPSTAGDEALARKLSEQINGRERSSRSAASGAPPMRGSRGRGGRGKARGRGRGSKANGARSADTIDDSGNEGSEGDESKKKKGGGLSKEYILSEPLAALVEEDSLSRPQVVKKLWAYIKTNSLQNPTNGREIMCDGALRAVFNTDKIDMFKMNKELGKHLSEPSETTA